MMGKTIPLTAEALFAQKMIIAQLEAEKRRLSLLLNSAIANHNDLAIRSNAKKITSLNRKIEQLADRQGLGPNEAEQTARQSPDC